MASLKRLLLQDIFVGQIAGAYTTAAISLDDAQGFAIVSQSTDVATTAKTFLTSDITLSTIHKAAHGYETGLAVKFSTTVTLPTGLNSTDVFYLTNLSADYILVSTTQANAMNGVYLTFSGGSGTHTITPETSTPVYLKIEATIDGTIWAEIDNSLIEITSTPKIIEHEAAYFHSMRVSIINETGQHDLSSKIMIRGGPF